MLSIQQSLQNPNQIHDTISPPKEAFNHKDHLFILHAVILLNTDVQKRWAYFVSYSLSARTFISGSWSLMLSAMRRDLREDSLSSTQATVLGLQTGIPNVLVYALRTHLV